MRRPRTHEKPESWSNAFFIAGVIYAVAQLLRGI